MDVIIPPPTPCEKLSMALFDQASDCKVFFIHIRAANYTLSLFSMMTVAKRGKKPFELSVQPLHFMNRGFVDQGSHVMVDHFMKFGEVEGFKKEICDAQLTRPAPALGAVVGGNGECRWGEDPSCNPAS